MCVRSGLTGVGRNVRRCTAHRTALLATVAGASWPGSPLAAFAEHNRVGAAARCAFGDGRRADGFRMLRLVPMGRYRRAPPCPSWTARLSAVRAAGYQVAAALYPGARCGRGSWRWRYRVARYCRSRRRHMERREAGSAVSAAVAATRRLCPWHGRLPDLHGCACGERMCTRRRAGPAVTRPATDAHFNAQLVFLRANRYCFCYQLAAQAAAVPNTVRYTLVPIGQSGQADAYYELVVNCDATGAAQSRVFFDLIGTGRCGRGTDAKRWLTPMAGVRTDR